LPDGGTRYPLLRHTEVEIVSESVEDRDPEQSRESDQSEEDDSFVPSADAGPTRAEKYSRDEKDHGRQDHGP
jgi:hypothetical protein